jgi:acyl-coenzyme A synthetase/AMP-(fatty) acid ligase
MHELREGGGSAIFESVVRAARTLGARTAFIERGRPLSGDSLADRLVEATHRFAGAGVVAGDVALLAIRPGVDALVVTLALIRLGAVATPVDPGAGPELFRSRLEALRPRWVVGESLLYAASARGPIRWLLRPRGLELPSLAQVNARHVVLGPRLPGRPPGACSWEDLGRGMRSSEAALPPADQIDPEAVAMVVFTSGTTGHPKGVQHTGRSAAAMVSAIMVAMTEHIAPHETPLMYNYSLQSMLAALLLGVPTRIAPLRVKPGSWLRDIARHGATDAFVRPSDAVRIALHCESTGSRIPSCLRTMYFYSAPATRSVLQRVISVAGRSLTICSVYGMTEVGPVAWIHARSRLAWRGTGDLVGTPVPGLETRIGDTGTLLVRGPTVHKGYLGQEARDWHDSGDLARVEDDGSIVLLGRAKDMILRDSFNIYPSLYEETICRIGGVSECAMVGVAHPETANERVVLFVAPDPAVGRSARTLLSGKVAAALREGALRIDGKALPDQVLVVDALPRNRRRKVDRPALRLLALGSGDVGHGRLPGVRDGSA